MNRQEELLMEEGEEVRDGRAEGLSAFSSESNRLSDSEPP